MKAILTGSTITIERDSKNKFVYPIEGIIAIYTGDSGIKKLSLCDKISENVLISVTDSPLETNLIFGSSDPDSALASCQANIGTSGTSGGSGSAATDTATGLDNSLDIEAIKVTLGATTEVAPATDTATSGMSGRLQRVAQNLTSLIALLPSSIGRKASSNSLSVTLATSEVLPLPTGASTETTLAAILAELRDDIFVSSTLWEDRSLTVAVFYREERNRNQDDGTVTTVYTRLSDNVVVGSMPGSVIPVIGANDREIKYYRWKAKNAGTGYGVGDWLSNTIIFDTDGTGSVISSTWYNLSTSTAISGTPLNADLVDPNDQLLTTIGAQADTVATSDTGTFSLVAISKRLAQNITTAITTIGDSADVTVPATNTSTSTIKGLLRFVANILNPSSSSLAASGIATASDIVVNNRIRTISFHNNTATTLYLQIHNKVGALALNDVPFQGSIYRLPGNSTIVYGIPDFGFFGRVFGVQAQQRIGISSTFATYTAATMTNTAINIEVI